MRSDSCILASTIGGPKKCLNYGGTEYSLIIIGHHNTCGTARAVDYTQQDAWKNSVDCSNIKLDIFAPSSYRQIYNYIICKNLPR